MRNTVNTDLRTSDCIPYINASTCLGFVMTKSSAAPVLESLRLYADEEFGRSPTRGYDTLLGDVD